MNPRMRRLQRDYEKLQDLAARSKFVSIQATEGNPPEKYVLKLTCKGIAKLNSRNQPRYSRSHLLGIALTRNYPRKPPHFKVTTPIFHPNIGQSGTVCIGDEGDHGYAPSMGLDDLIIRIVEIIRYENTGLDSPFNIYAAGWAERNQCLFPLEDSQIVGEELLEINLLEDITIIDQDEGEGDLDIVIL